MANPRASRPSAVQTGDILLGRYRVGEQIAEGGHSLVFRADDERLRRPACVKLFHPSTSEPTFKAAIEERFVQEAFLLARMIHPAAIKIFDFGYFRCPAADEPEIPFQVNELVPGGPLSRWVKKRGRLSAREVVGLLTPIAHVLGELHAMRVAHLDVKPQNILLARTLAGRDARLADFGIAETLAPRPAGGVRSVLLYSVNWAAPEQMVGDPIAASSDVYALALVTVFALTGRLVFSEPDPTRAYRARKASSDALVDAVAGAQLPDGLIDLFARAIHFDPCLRFGDVMEFFGQVERLLAAGDDSPVPTLVPNDESGPSSGPLAADGSPSDRVTAANLWQLSPGEPCPTIAGRKVTFVPVDEAGGSVDLEGAEHLRLRVSFVAAGSGAALHVKGLNCFVAVAGRRPSSALTIEGSAVLELYSAGGERIGGAEATFAVAGPTRTVVSVASQSLVVPTDRCAQLIALDFGEGQTCALLCAPG